MPFLYRIDSIVNDVPLLFLPRDDDNKVHDVPGVPEVGVRMEDEAHGHDLGDHLHGEDAHEVRLQLLLQHPHVSRVVAFLLRPWCDVIKLNLSGPN